MAPQVCDSSSAVAFLYDTRLKFLENGEGGGKGAPMSCAMVYWGTDYEKFSAIFSEFGAVVPLKHLHDRDIGPKKAAKRGRTLFK